jgi:ABC-2 type transport system permease protein
MRAALIIARKELAQRLRDRTFFIIGIAAPLILAFIFNLILGGVVGPGGGEVDFDFGLVNEDPGPVGGGFETMLTAMEAEGIVTLTRFDDRDAGQEAVDGGDVDAVFLLPSDLSLATLSGRQSTITVLGNVDAEIGATVANALAASFVGEVRTASLGAQAALAVGVIGLAGIDDAAARAAQAATPLAVETIEVRSRQVDTTTFFIAGLGIFFVFFIVGLSVTSMMDERHHGTLARLIAAPIRPGSIVAGKVIASIVLGILAMFILAIASTLIMGADWGNPLAAAGIIIATVFAAAGLMTFVGSLARTSEQAGNLQSIVALTMAMLGGTFIPISSTDGLLGALRFVTPNAWYMQGLGDVAGGAYADAWLAAAILVGIGVVFGAVGLALVHRAVRP